MSWLNPGMVTFVGAILVAIGTLWGFMRQSARSDEIADLNRRLAAKSDEIATLAKENLGTATGGDSYAFVNLLNPWHRFAGRSHTEWQIPPVRRVGEDCE
jgi:hypothetical protein